MLRKLLTITGILLLFASAPPALPAQDGGNSVNAHACQHGGWQDFAPSENPLEAFASQGECVSYGAHGGAIVALVFRQVLVTWSPDSSGYAMCVATIKLIGYPIDVAHQVQLDLYVPGQSAVNKRILDLRRGHNCENHLLLPHARGAGRGGIRGWSGGR